MAFSKTALFAGIFTALSLFLNALSLPFPQSDLLRVTQGYFSFGAPYLNYDEDEYPAVEVSVHEFFIYRYEVSNKLFCMYLNARNKEKKLINNAGEIRLNISRKLLLCNTLKADKDAQIKLKKKRFIPISGKADFPVIEVTWYGAVDFCNWLNELNSLPPVFDLENDKYTGNNRRSFRLPLECEWEKSAGWNKAINKKYTYSFQRNSLSSAWANYLNSHDPFEKESVGTTPCGFYDGNKRKGYQTKNAISKTGCYDMSGNVYEWCVDTYVKDGFKLFSRMPNRNTPRHFDLNNPFCVVKGGSWNSFEDELRVTNRSDYKKETACNFIGFRFIYVRDDF